MVELSHAFGSLVGAKPLAVLGVEFSSGNVRLACMRVSAIKKEVIALIEKDIQSLSSEEVTQFIQQSLTLCPAKNFRTVYVIPSHLVITKNIELPSQDQHEIEDIVNLQASRHTPYGKEEISIDYVNIGSYQKNYTKILLVIVNRDAVRRNFEILKSAGIEPNKVSFSSEAVAKTISKFLTLEKEATPVGLIHIDTAFTDFNVLLKNKILFVRSIPIGIQHLTVERERQWDKFIEEIKQSLEVYKNEDIDALPTKLLITGVVDIAKELAGVVEGSLTIPTENISYPERFSFTEEAQKICSSSKLTSFLGAISAAYAVEDIKINLIPEEAKLKRRFEAKSREIIKTGISLLSIFLLTCALFVSNIYLKNIYLTKLNNRFDKVHKEAEIIERDFNRVKLIKSYFSKRGYSVDILGEFYKLLPGEIKIAELRFDKKGDFAFKGTAASLTLVFSFVEDLNKSEYFKKAETRYTSTRKEGNKDVADFEIIATFGREN
ncbi:MAG: pilus assembly protein PilM [Candidatus Omnitrophota bacterium]|nr:MAG: pilus assembly protein PilM [Candidatus Omnitrophota bacterium]